MNSGGVKVLLRKNSLPSISTVSLINTQCKYSCRYGYMIRNFDKYSIVNVINCQRKNEAEMHLKKYQLTSQFIHLIPAAMQN